MAFTGRNNNSSVCKQMTTFSPLLLVSTQLVNIPTPYNVGSVLRRLYSTAGDSISTCGGIASVLWRLFITMGNSISTCGG